MPTEVIAWRAARAGLRAIALGCALVASGCGGGDGGGSSTSPAPPAPTPIPPPVGDRVLVGAGDIGECGLAGAEATGKLLDGISGTVFTAGDNAYYQGTAQQFQQCYDPFWGRQRGRTRPAPGNHEYESPNAGPYFDYFGEFAAPAAPGFYSFTLGAWQVYSLNTNIPIDAASFQLQWLRRELQAVASPCALAIMHHPRFSSGQHGSDRRLRDIWSVLYDGGVDVVVTGHDHAYERFAPQDPDGRSDLARGIRQFVVGTGGANLYRFGAVAANSEVRGEGSWGVIKFTLRSGDYDWEFVPVPGATFRDSGTGTCH